MATLNGLPANIAQPVNRHNYNGIARVDPLADRANVKIAWADWVANTYLPAVANAIPVTSIATGATTTVTSPGHGLTNGNQIILMGVVGVTNTDVDDRSGLNEQTYTVASAAANTFVLSNVNTVGYTSYVTGGSFFVAPTGFSYTGLGYV